MSLDLCIGVCHVSPQVSPVTIQACALLQFHNVQVSRLLLAPLHLLVLLSHLLGVLQRVELHQVLSLSRQYLLVVQLL